MLAICAAIAAIALVIAVGSYAARRFVRHNAPFYGTPNILIVGGGIGFFAWLGVAGLWMLFHLPTSLAWLGFLCGLIAIAFIGVRPSRLDWAKKSRQVAFVGAVSYALLVGISFLLGR